ncbi:MAG: neutral/alkaline non-lysosomal ceramidase N-terminal domain-containing protein [Victivallaceae bacterium]|nr:neutral/alkaline non-lysosomal ceramidase N-terminal domain-containing protein [Victivallaceae bacterium]
MNKIATCAICAGVALSAAAGPQLKVGCAERELSIPLFAELYGYANYCERRNTGVIEPLYCRAFSFNDGNRRAVIIYTDTCSTDDKYAAEMRKAVSEKYKLDPDGIAFVATHTHSAPSLFESVNGSHSGIPYPPFQRHWKETVLEVAGAAISDEEPVAEVVAGRSVPSAKISRNRVERETNITDPAIRWAKFNRADGSTKVLLHNFGMHPVCGNGAMWMKAGSDWPGCANRHVKEERLADMPLFLLGPAGDQMPLRTCLDTNSPDGVEIETKLYMDELKRGLSSGEKLSDTAVSFFRKAVDFPVRVQTPEQLRADAVMLRESDRKAGSNYWTNKALRLDEMAMILEKGGDLGARRDLQVIRIGGISIFFVPGELYVELGMRLMAQAKSKFPFVATVSNGNSAYIFTEASGRKYNDISSRDDKVFGFYEVNLYMQSHHFRYENNVGDFVVDELLKLE